MADEKTAEMWLAREYSEGRPDYPPELFRFIASKTPHLHLAWDVATGSGQAAQSLAKIYDQVIATDVSQNQLDFAPRLPNVLYRKTPPAMSPGDLQRVVSGESTVDLITVAQAIHWFHLPSFYSQARWILKKPHGVVAAWCYTLPEVVPGVDAVLRRLYTGASAPFWDPARQMVDEAYRSIDFPFDPVEGEDGTGPVGFASEKEMDLERYLTYLRSWSAYRTAKEKGVELLGEDVVEEFRRAWMEDGDDRKMVRFPVYLRIGKVGNPGGPP